MKNETLAEVSQSQLMSPMAFSVQSAARRDLTKTIAGHNNIPVAINPPQHVNMTGTYIYRACYSGTRVV